MSNAPTNTIGAPITDQRMFPDMNEPPITSMPWKNHTPPTRTSSTPMTRRVTIATSCTPLYGLLPLPSSTCP